MSIAKSTIQALLDEGFTADGFGTPADFAAAGTGYLARVIALASGWVMQRVGQTAYDGVQSGTYAFNQMARAETLYASAVLWRRRIKFIDGSATGGLQQDQYKILAALEQQAADAEQAAFDATAEALLAIGADTGNAIPGSNVSAASVETGRFPSRSSDRCVAGWPGRVTSW